MSLKFLVNPSDPPPEPLIVAETINSRNDNITILWCNTWTGSGNIRLCNEDDVVLSEDILEINRYLSRVVDTLLYGDNCIKSKTEIDHWLTFALGQLDLKNRDHVDYTYSLMYLNKALLTRTWLCCKKFTLADIHVYCALLRNGFLEKEPLEDYVNITRWYKHMQSLTVVRDALIRMKKNTLPKEQMEFCAEQTNEQTKTRKQEGKFIDLPGAEMGKVVVRFPPEASGYLHIGHAKAALLNQYYAEAFKGQFIMRFDDTNPAKETTEFEEAILEDLRLLQIKPDRFTHTSDYFDTLQDYCTQLIKEGKAYVDDTPAHIMKEQREQKLKSENRDNPVEKNLALWEEMQRGTEKGQECCVRAKIDYESTNGCMRDPTIYRCKLELHPYTQDKYKVYPTYDFACPIVDSIENVTHTLRTTEYHDRDVQFYWILDALGLRRPHIWEYSRLNMTHTVLSKRKLTWFVNEGLVDGWNDPRFPTVRGILRRGMTVEGLKQFIIAQGSSRSVVFMEWDKIWAINKKVIDSEAFRYTALDYDKLVPVHVLDAKEGWLVVQNHPKHLDKGFKNVITCNKVYVEDVDAMNLVAGQSATFINWGNLKILEVNKRQDGSIIDVHARLDLDNRDYKNTLKITWLVKPSDTINNDTVDTNSIPCYAVYFDHIISVPVLGKDDDFKDFIAKDTRKEVRMLGEVALKNVKKGEIIQIQRKGYFICDVPYAPLNFFSSRERPLILFHIPDGHMSTPSATSQKGDQQKSKKLKVSKDKITMSSAEDILYDKIQKQSEKFRLIQSVLNEEQRILNNLQAEYKTVTGNNWISKETTETKSGETSIEQEMSQAIQKQGDKVRNLKSSKAEKSLIDEEVKILLSLKNGYKNVIGQDWKPGQVATPSASSTSNAEERHMVLVREISKAIQERIDEIENWKPGQVAAASTASDTKTESKESSKAKQISDEIQKQGDKVRNLKSSKAEKSIIDEEVKILLSLKDDYKKATGQDWKPGQVASASTASDTKTERMESSKAKQISDELQKLADKLRNLKGSESKKNISENITILLSLKEDYKKETGQDWEPDQIAATSTASDTKTESKESSKAKQISDEIQKQGDKVRNLKSSKAEKSIIDEEVKILLSLKDDYKKATGQDWKPGKVAAASTASDTKTESKESSKAKQISDEIQKQGDKVRNLKSSKAEKSIIDEEVKILLSLKDDYKKATGQDWKPDQVAAASTASDTKTESKESSKAKQISDEIQKQGDKVRNLKSSKAEKSIIDEEVKILLSLKDDYKKATGQDWKSDQVAAVSTASDTKTERMESSKAKQIYDELQKLADKLGNLKNSEAEKSISEKITIILSLKEDYKNATGQDWEPDQIAAASTTSDTKTERMESSIAKQISDELQKLADKLRNLKSSEAEKSISEKITFILSLKEDYKKETGQDWKPDQIAATSTASDTKTESKESKESSKAKQISDEIQKQGDKVRNLKSSKAEKSIIDEEVKILLSFKLDYKNATGQYWKPPKAEVEPEKKKEKSPKAAEAEPKKKKEESPKAVEAQPKKKKEESPKAAKSMEKEIAKGATSKDMDSTKTGTRLGLEVKKNENFFDWYSQIITKSGMIEYYDVSGCYILRPWSFAIWKIIKDYIDKVITGLGVHECYFPIFVTRNVLEKEKTHIADFAPEVAWVTKCGESDLAEPIAIRPTSETIMYPAYAKWLKSDTELPLRLNQWNNVVRWEFKDPKPFLRTREFLWQEGHTAFATKAEADQEVLTILDMYGRVYEDILAVPVIKGRKTEKEKFAGGDYTTTVEAFVSTSGRAIQGATSHHLGQNFSKMFNIQVEGIEGDEKTFVYQNSWGLTTRTIGVMIMVHGDDKGLVLPPKVASIEAVVVPCGITASTTAAQRETLQLECMKLVSKLQNESFKVHGDFRNNRTPGWKFNHWELKGVPVRIELGPKDLEKDQVTLVRRDTSERSTAKSDEVVTVLSFLLNDIQTQLFRKARQTLYDHIKQVENWNDFAPELNKKNLLLSPFCGEPSCEERIKADSAREESDEPGASMGAKSLCIPFEQPELTKPLNEMSCIHHSCTNKPKSYTLFGRSY